MVLRVDPAWAALVLLVGLRVAPLFVMAPVLGSVRAPNLVRALLVVALSAAVVGVSGAALAAVPASLAELLLLAVTELVVGAALAFGLAAAFAAFLFAGRLLDLQFGFGVASLIDPSTRAHAPLLGTALNLAAVCVFFAADGHHLLIRALALSLMRPRLLPRALALGRATRLALGAAPLAVVVELADYARRAHAFLPGVELFLDLVLDQLALLLDHQDLFQPLGEAPRALRLERPGHGDLVDADPEVLGNGFGNA